MDVDAIPSLKLVIPTFVEEQELEYMNVDSNMEEKNATMHHLALGAPQHKNEEDE